MMVMELHVQLKLFLRSHCTGTYILLRKARYSFMCLLNRERKIRCGELNPDKNFYVIRLKTKGIGLMVYYTSAIGNIKYALEKGYIPVVDMQNYSNPYLSNEKNGKENSWEYYFQQPYKYSLDEVNKSKNVYLSFAYTSNTAMPRTFYSMLQQDGKQYFDIINKYMRFSDEFNSLLDSTYKKLFPYNERVLGVSSRGTDMINFPKHSKLPPRQALLETAKELMKKYRCNYLFLATEENQVVDYFKSVLGEKVICDERRRYDGFQNSGKQVLTEMSFNRESDEYLKGQEYLLTVALLSKCDCIVGTLVGSTIGAICMNGGKYEHIEILDLGTY